VLHGWRKASVALRAIPQARGCGGRAWPGISSATPTTGRWRRPRSRRGRPGAGSGARPLPSPPGTTAPRSAPRGRATAATGSTPGRGCGTTRPAGGSGRRRAGGPAGRGRNGLAGSAGGEGSCPCCRKPPDSARCDGRRSGWRSTPGRFGALPCAKPCRARRGRSCKGSPENSMTVGSRPVQPSEARRLPQGTAKRQARNERSQTRMPGGVGGAGSNPAPTRFGLRFSRFEVATIH